MGPGPVLLTLVEVPEVLFLRLVDAGEDTGCGISQSLEAAGLGQLHLQVLPLMKQLLVLTGKVWSLNRGFNRGRVRTIRGRCRPLDS